MHKNGTHLVLGGVASGKSAFAEGLLADHPDRHYIATAQAFDDEMRAKIADHVAARGDGWKTIEAPLDLPDALRQVSASPVLIDCVTFWLSNLLLAEAEIPPQIDALCDAITAHDGLCVLVSNEVGTAPVATTSLGRAFQNVQGRANQRLAQVADRVTLVTAGLPMELKS